MTNSFNKRELEKKKEQKRKEKQQRKEERKAGGVKSFDEMIAYVDENGMITNTPPDPDKKTKVNVDDIAVSTPKKEELETPELRGRVEHFNAEKGYGFIKNLSGIDKYFFHISHAPSTIAEGNTVTFELERGDRGLNAINITLVK
jgi:cold shock CspA family protein